MFTGQAEQTQSGVQMWLAFAFAAGRRKGKKRPQTFCQL